MFKICRYPPEKIDHATTVEDRATLRVIAPPQGAGIVDVDADVDVDVEAVDEDVEAERIKPPF